LDERWINIFKVKTAHNKDFSDKQNA